MKFENLQFAALYILHHTEMYHAMHHALSCLGQLCSALQLCSYEEQGMGKVLTCSELQCIAIQQCSAVQCSAVMHCSGTVQCCCTVIQCSGALYYTVMHCSPHPVYSEG